MNRLVGSVRGAALALGLLFASAPHAMALDEAEATAFVQNVVDRVIALIETNYTTAARRSEFRGMLTEVAAMPQIGKFAAGRNWRQMDEAQQGRYEVVFIDYIATIYARRFEEYSGEKLAVVSSKDMGKGVFVVKSEVARQGAQPILIEWVVSDRSGSVRIDDIQIEGVSLAITQREEFAAMIAQKGDNIDAFLNELAARAEI